MDARGGRRVGGHIRRAAGREAVAEKQDGDAAVIARPAPGAGAAPAPSGGDWFRAEALQWARDEEQGGAEEKRVRYCIVWEKLSTARFCVQTRVEHRDSTVQDNTLCGRSFNEGYVGLRDVCTQVHGIYRGGTRMARRSKPPPHLPFPLQFLTSHPNPNPNPISNPPLYLSRYSRSCRVCFARETRGLRAGRWCW